MQKTAEQLGIELLEKIAISDAFISRAIGNSISRSLNRASRLRHLPVSGRLESLAGGLANTLERHPRVTQRLFNDPRIKEYAATQGVTIPHNTTEMAYGLRGLKNEIPSHASEINEGMREIWSPQNRAKRQQFYNMMRGQAAEMLPLLQAFQPSPYYRPGSIGDVKSVIRLSKP